MVAKKGTGQCTRIIKWNVDSWVNPCNVFFVVGCTPTWTVSELMRVTRRQSTDIPFSSGGVDGLVRETISECGRWIIIRDHQLTESLWSVVCVDERCLRAAQCSSNMQQPLASTRRSWIVDQVHFREPATCESDAKLCSCPARNVSVDDSFSASSLTKYCALSTLCAYFTRVESTQVFAAKLATTQLPTLRQRIKVGLGWWTHLQRLPDVVHFNEIQSKSGSAERGPVSIGFFAASTGRWLCFPRRTSHLLPEENPLKLNEVETMRTDAAAKWFKVKPFFFLFCCSFG